MAGASLPPSATIGVNGGTAASWATSTTDPRGLQNPSGSGRSASTWYTFDTMTFDVNTTDGQAHKLALYAVDWNNRGTQEQVQVIDPATGSVLDTETLSNFGGGDYLQWTISGHVQIKVTRLAGPTAIVSGLFLDPAPTTTATGLSAPALALSPRALDAALRSAVLARPVNRFEEMLARMAAMRGHGLATPRMAGSPAPTTTGIEAPSGPPPVAGPTAGTRPQFRTASASVPVQDEALSQIMALDPIFPKSKTRSPFS